MSPFSLLIPVYHGDDAGQFLTAVRSVTTSQTVRPAETVVVVDGPVGDDINAAIDTLALEVEGLKIVPLPKNGGLGPALAEGMLHCTYELVARMDADDIAVPDRFEHQLAYMEQHPDVAVAGGQIAEFIGDEQNIVAYRNVPLEPAACRRYYRDRDPLNHMTVMLRRSAVLAVGNYQAWHLDEDSYLWGRLLAAGYEVGNVPQVLVHVRVGEQMYARRGGWRYFKSDMGMLRWKRRQGLTSWPHYAWNWLVRFTVYVTLPNKARAAVFNNLLRGGHKLQ